MFSWSGGSSKKKTSEIIRAARSASERLEFGAKLFNIVLYGGGY